MRVTLWVAATVTVAIGVGQTAMSGAPRWPLMVLLCGLAVVVCHFGDRLSRFTTVSLADFPTLSALLILEPGPATLVAVAAGLAWGGPRGLLSRVANVALLGLPVFVGALVFHELLAVFQIYSPWQAPLAWFLLALVAATVNSFAYWMLNAAVVSRLSGQPVAHYVRDVVIPIGKLEPVTVVPVVVLVQVAVMFPGEAKALPLMLGVGCVVGAWFFARSAQRQVAARELKDEFFRAIFVSLARLLEMKDPETAVHSARVARYSSEIARELGLSEEDQSRIHLAGLLHDVGKVGVPDWILQKPGRLSDDERLAMQRHSRLSAEAIAGIPGFGDLTRMVYAHHERLDGSGYPEGIGGADVPLGARIIGVADTFEALTADRPYRDGRPPAAALTVIEDEIHLFDPDVVSALRSAHSNRMLSRGGDTVAEFTEEWSRAARYLDVRPDERPFQVPPELAPPPVPQQPEQEVAKTEAPGSSQ